MGTVIAVDHGGSQFRVRVQRDGEMLVERAIAHEGAPSDPLGTIA